MQSRIAPGRLALAPVTSIALAMVACSGIVGIGDLPHLPDAGDASASQPGGDGGGGTDGGAESGVGGPDTGDGSPNGPASSGSSPGNSSGSGSSSGSGTSSGSSSGSGSGGSTPDAGCGPPSLIDDMENQTDGLILAVCGRSGSWYGPTMGGFFDPSSAMPNGSTRTGHALHAYASGVAYHVVGFTFTATKWPYDATQFGYTGLSFYAMLGSDPDAGVTNPSTTAYLQLDDQYSDPIAGKCSLTSGGGLPACDVVATSVLLTTTWTLYTVPFSAFVTVASVDAGGRSVDPTAMFLLQFGLPGASFDIWIDDISFE